MLDFLAETWNDLQTFLYSLVLTIKTIMEDIGTFFFESFLNITLLALDGLDSFFSGLDIASYTNSLPAEVSYYASALGLSQAMGMIISAITIRLSLQLIPFVRLGS